MANDEAADAAAKLQEMTLNDTDKELEAYLEVAKQQFQAAKKAGVNPRGRPNPTQRRKRYHPFERPPAQPVAYAPVTTVAPDGTVELHQSVGESSFRLFVSEIVLLFVWMCYIVSVSPK
ncbi:hypothetical protein GE061_012840 [Apolygus lucorum]|uniref:Uncharacterized protein n=1 Tax=Apolygus lucorum TaxID=248454 RepID=A0A8S9XVM8_APOLU|nr:hypothetical protein GE061_012840 [Apolygus lucorum]